VTESFLDPERKLTSSFVLVQHLDECRPYANEVIFYQRVRKQLLKLAPGGVQQAAAMDKAVRDLVDDSIESEGVVDILSVAGIATADISILDERFLASSAAPEYENLRIRLLERILHDELDRRTRTGGPARARSFRQLLELTLAKYHNRVISAAQVIQGMIRIRGELERDSARATGLGLDPDGLAFYDAVAGVAPSIDEALLSGLIHDVVAAIKRNLKVDWTEPHREDVRAAMRTEIRRVLRQRGFTAEVDPLVHTLMERAQALYADWSLAA